MSGNNIVNVDDNDKKEAENEKKVEVSEEIVKVKENDVEKVTTSNNTSDTDNKEQLLTQDKAEETLEVNDKQNSQPIINKEETPESRQNEPSNLINSPNTTTSPTSTSSTSNEQSSEKNFVKKITSKLDKFINPSGSASISNDNDNNSLTANNINIVDNNSETISKPLESLTIKSSTTDNETSEETSNDSSKVTEEGHHENSREIKTENILTNHQVDDTQADKAVEYNSQPTTPVTETGEQSPKKFYNFVNKFGNVRGFFRRSATTVVDKLREEFDELDRRMYLKDDSIVYEEEPGVIDGQNTEQSNHKKIEENSERDQLLEGSNINDSKLENSTNDSIKHTQSTHQALAETANALNERAEKLDQINDKLETMTDNSNNFLKMAKELSEQQQAKDKKWIFF